MNIEQRFLVSSIRRRLKCAKSMLVKKKTECPQAKALTLALNSNFLDGSAIGYWEGQIAVLSELEISLTQK